MTPKILDCQRQAEHTEVMALKEPLLLTLPTRRVLSETEIVRYAADEVPFAEIYGCQFEIADCGCFTVEAELGGGRDGKILLLSRQGALPPLNRLAAKIFRPSPSAERLAEDLYASATQYRRLKHALWNEPEDSQRDGLGQLAGELESQLESMAQEATSNELRRRRMHREILALRELESARAAGDLIGANFSFPHLLDAWLLNTASAKAGNCSGVVVMEHVPHRQSLREYLEEFAGATRSEAEVKELKAILSGTIAGLLFLIKHEIYHLDFHAGQVLLRDRIGPRLPVITDFGQTALPAIVARNPHGPGRDAKWSTGGELREKPIPAADHLQRHLAERFAATVSFHIHHGVHAYRSEHTPRASHPLSSQLQAVCRICNQLLYDNIPLQDALQQIATVS